MTCCLLQSIVCCACFLLHLLILKLHFQNVDSDYSTESQLDALNRDIQSPEPELLYYSGPEHLVEGITEDMNVLSWNDRSAEDWSQM